MPKFLITKKAVADLTAIWNYTFDVWSEAQADKYYDLLIATCNEVAKNPEKGKKYFEIQPKVFGVKVGRHVIFYRVVRLGEVEVLRILHEQLDLKRTLEFKP